MIIMGSMAVPDLISDIFDPIQSQFYQPDIYGDYYDINNYDIFLTHPEYVTGLSELIHPLSEFRPERQRIIYPTEKLMTGEDDLTAFKECYDSGSIDSMVEKHGFSPPQYLGLFFVSGLESASHMTVTDQDKKNMSLFLEWAYENRHSFDALKSTHSIEKYIEDRPSAIWSRTPETIYLDDMQSYILNLDSFLDKLDMFDKLVKSKDRVQEFDFFKDINRSVRNYLQDNIDKRVNADLIFNTLKQKHQNQYAPSVFIDVYRFSEKRGLFRKDRFRQRRVLELFSSSYLKRDMNGTLDAHKYDLQEIYEDLGGNRELFPYQEPVEKQSTEGIIIVRDRGHKHSSRKSGSGVTRIPIREK